VDESENYTVLINFDQYLWIEGGSLALYKKRIASSNYSGAGRRQQAPNGIGIFGRAGWAPKDRNVIDQFYSLGVGGYGMLIPGRDYDQWGIGWSGTHISSDFRDDTDLLGIDLNSYEHAVEAFYNFQLTPAAHLTVNAQVIDSMAESVDTAKTLGARLQLDF
jgi:carbohydrate-selective porin OprB